MDDKELEYLPEEDLTTDILTLLDENDEEVQFEVLGRTDYNGESYIAAMEYFDDPQKALEAEPYVYIFKEGDEDEEGFLTYDIVEDDDELYEVQEIFKYILKDYFDWE